MSLVFLLYQKSIYFLTKCVQHALPNNINKHCFNMETMQRLVLSNLQSTGKCTVSFNVVCNQTLHDKRHKSRVYAMYTHSAVLFNCQLYIRVREPSIVCCWSIPYNKAKYFLARLVFHCEKRTNMRQARHEYTLVHSIIHGCTHTLRCVVYVSSSSRDFWNSCFLKDAMSFKKRKQYASLLYNINWSMQSSSICNFDISDFQICCS